MRTIFLLVGLLLSSAGVFAQGKKKAAPAPPIDHDGKVAVPVKPALPGEEKLSARERVERDFLMPVRRKQSVSKAESVAIPSPSMTARNIETAREAEAEAAAKVPEKLVAEPVAASTAKRTSARTASATRTSHKATSHKTSAARKAAARKKAAALAQKKKTRRHRR
ncbi:hypothetical protein [Hymenobacter sp. DG25B]|uniref:hypothetical protein n=1 Tax=Hymenobacter sp. DG25B TaxID=1385664 RepID=UPI0012E04A92|nr:hypothetical protein [Hymenobacter sp. DG25B]